MTIQTYIVSGNLYLCLAKHIMTDTSPNYYRWTLWLIAGLLVFRLCGLFLSPLGLHGDEAQYWDWSKNLDWGYFTKPPMIAWVIAATTGVFGDAEWAVRLSSPILHSFTAYFIFCTARLAYDARTGFWAALLYITMPGLWLSSGIVSTDVPLLLCWVLAMNAWLHLREQATWGRAAQLGIAFGLGMMSKYAMLFFLPALGIAFLFDPATRKGLNTLKGYSAGLLALVIITPNIVWNLNNDFATLTHTAANANIESGIPFHPGELLTFWADQLVVFGPVTIVLMVLALKAALQRRLLPPSIWIAAFALSPLLIISIEALLSRANANWAVTAYIGASILTAHYGLHFWPRLKTWMKGGMGLNAVMGTALAILVIFPALTDALGLANSFKRLRAWPKTVNVIESRIAAGHDGQAFSVVATDKRIVFYDLKYYGLDQTLPLKMWMYTAAPENHAELTYPLLAQEGPVLVINYYDNYVDEMQADFERLVTLEPLDIDLGGGKRRKLALWAGYGYAPTNTR